MMSREDCSLLETMPGHSTREIEVVASADEKEYDGTHQSAQAPRIIGDLAGEHLVIVTQRFQDKNAGKTMLVPSIRIVDRSGELVDYSLTTRYARGGIHPRVVKVSAKADVKEYDGTTFSAIVPRVSQLGEGDTAVSRQVFDTPEVGNGKTLTPEIRIEDGNGAKNYVVLLFPIHTGAILPPDLDSKPNILSVLAGVLGTEDFILTTMDGVTNFTGEVCYADEKKLFLKLEARKRVQIIIEIERIHLELAEIEIGKRLQIVAKGKEIQARLVDHQGSPASRGR